jgi:hypothetical protein
MVGLPACSRYREMMTHDHETLAAWSLFVPANLLEKNEEREQLTILLIKERIKWLKRYKL